MTTLVLGTVGAIAGNAILPGIGGQIGWLVGSMLGSLIDPPKTQGPRLGDLKLQRSSYGSMIPIVFGTARIAGNCIDQTDLEEHSETTGGKGGPEVENFTYSASFDLALCEGPILGARRIWADGRLIWEDGASGDMPCTLYLGSETQGPDPTFEAIHGAGEVPAYRGIAHAVFTDYMLTDFGNRIPLFEFEVYTGAGDIPWRVSTFTPWPDGVTSHVGASISNGVITTSHYVSVSGRYYEHSYLVDGTSVGPDIDVGISFAVTGEGFLQTVVLNLSGVACYNSYNHPSFYGWFKDELTSLEITGTVPVGNSSIWQDDYCYSATTGTVLRYRMDDGDPPPFAGISDASYALDSAYSASNITLGTSNDGHVWVTVDGVNKLWKLDADLNLVHFWDTGDWDSAIDGIGLFNFHVYNNLLCFDNGFATRGKRVVRVNGDWTFTVVGDIDAISGPCVTLGGGLVLVRDGVISLVPPPASVVLGDIVAALSSRTPCSSYDTAELTDEVRGFVIGSQMTVRNAIHVLRQGFGFDAVESDDEVKFRKRDGTSIATIPDDDLCAHEYGADEPEPLKTTRKQEAELPRTVTVTYIDQDLDYQTGAQHSPRQVTSSEADVTLELPIVFTAGEAQQRAWVLQMGEWIEREEFEWSLSRKWARLEPCDIVNVRGRVIRITKRNETPAGVITFRGVLSAPSIYTQNATGSPAGEGTPEQPGAPGPAAATDLTLLDIPLVASGDYAYGPYAAVVPANGGSWGGATVYKSDDGGTNYYAVGSTVTSDIVGTVATALGDFTGGNVFDEANSITVVIGYGGGTLSSVSEEAVQNGANVCVLGSAATGWEVIQYRTATLTAPDTYMLTGLLRGRRGTEWMTSLHGASETFVVLPATININGSFAELGLSRKYKAVTFAGTIAGATAQDFTNSGVAIKPYSPVLLGGGRDGSGDLTLTWIPRRRGDGGWPDGVDLPATESDNWQVEIFTDNTYATEVRAFGITSPTMTYTAALQTTDFGSPQATVYWRVAQIGSAGLGYFTRAAT